MTTWLAPILPRPDNRYISRSRIHALVLRRVNATRLYWALLALFSAGASNVSTAQSLTSAPLAGEVRTMNGAPLPDAPVTINAAGGGQLRPATTDRNGTFS